MDAWIPFLQSLVWPAFISGLLLLYRPPLYSTFIALNERIREGASVKAFGVEVGARSLDKDETFKLLENAIQNALKAELGANLSPENILNIERNVAQRVKENSFLIIDSRPPDRNKGKEWTVSYYQYRTVSALLDDIRASVGALNFSFGSRWIIEVSGRRLTEKDIGRRWASAHHLAPAVDSRSLEQVGIKPGMILMVVAP